jgi:hypothetical protein
MKLFFNYEEQNNKRYPNLHKIKGPSQPKKTQNKTFQNKILQLKFLSMSFHQTCKNWNVVQIKACTTFIFVRMEVCTTCIQAL